MNRDRPDRNAGELLLPRWVFSALAVGLLGTCCLTIAGIGSWSDKPYSVLFRFEPRSVRLDGKAVTLDNGWLRFPREDATHVLEYVKPDGTRVRARLHGRASDDSDRHMEVKLDRITGLPRHEIVQVSPTPKLQAR